MMYTYIYIYIYILVLYKHIYVCMIFMYHPSPNPMPAPHSPRPPLRRQWPIAWHCGSGGHPQLGPTNGPSPHGGQVAFHRNVSLWA